VNVHGFGGHHRHDGRHRERQGSGPEIVSMSETSGLGANAKEESFRDQYIGGSGPFSLTKNGGTIEALTSATVTSRAFTAGVNAALAAAESMGGEG
jgi:electron transport complex protein RnfG